MRPILLVLLALGSLSLFAQQPAPPAGGAGRGPKNLKLLKPEEVRETMASFVAATGLTCDGCHVQGDRAADDKREKVVARKMIEMVRGINANNFNGDMKVSCFTCHRGDSHPKTAPDPK